MGRLNNYETVQRWAAHNEGRWPKHRFADSNNIHFDGPQLRSYRASIARYYGDSKNMYVLFTSQKWGVTTAHHISMAMRAIGNSVSFFSVPNIEGFGGERNDALHQENMRKLNADLAECERIAISGYKVRWSVHDGPDPDRLPQHFEKAIIYAYAKMVSYSQLTKTKLTTGLGTIQQVLDEVTRIRNEKWRVYMDPKAVANRERRAARADAKFALLGE